MAAARTKWGSGTTTPRATVAEAESRQRKSKVPAGSRSRRRDRDQDYVLDLCDEVLGQSASREHRFPWLVGDPDERGRTKTLPVEGYYERHRLVVEYAERQHDEPVEFFDKLEVLTASGVHRGEQRRLYDQRRVEEIPKRASPGRNPCDRPRSPGRTQTAAQP